jgi:hypothetical protein
MATRPEIAAGKNVLDAGCAALDFMFKTKGAWPDHETMTMLHYYIDEQAAGVVADIGNEADRAGIDIAHDALLHVGLTKDAEVMKVFCFPKAA